MEEIKTVDALFAKRFIQETPYVKEQRKKTDIKQLKMNNIEELFAPIQPISLIIKSENLI